MSSDRFFGIHQGHQDLHPPLFSFQRISSSNKTAFSLEKDTSTHARTHTPKHTHTHVWALLLSLSQARKCVQTNMNTFTPPFFIFPWHTLAHTHTLSHTRFLTCSLALKGFRRNSFFHFILMQRQFSWMQCDLATSRRHFVKWHCVKRQFANGQFITGHLEQYTCHTSHPLFAKHRVIICHR